MRAPWNGARGERGVVMDGVGEHVGRRRIFLELCIVSPDTAAGALDTRLSHRCVLLTIVCVQ